MCLIGYPDHSIYKVFDTNNKPQKKNHKSELSLASDYEKDMALFDTLSRNFSVDKFSPAKQNKSKPAS